MDLGLTKEQIGIQQAAKEFFEKEVRDKDIAREAEVTEAGYSLEVWRQMADLGFLGICFPEEYGGSSGDFVDLILVLEEMGKALVPGPFIPSVICSGHTVLHWGNNVQKNNFLPKLTSGNVIISPSLIKPVSSDCEKTVEDHMTIEKRHCVLNGTRLFVHYAHKADYFLHSMLTDMGPTLFLVNAKSPGIDYTLLNTIALDRQFEVIFNKVEVPKEYIVGEIGRGETIINAINEWGALSQCGYILGMLEQVLKMSIEYAKKRVQFERPIGSFQAIQHQFADMATDIDELKFLTYQAAWKLSQHLPARKDISMAKARASDACRRVSLLGCKIHGGIGIIQDYDMQLFFRRAKAAEVTFGDGDFHREVVAEQLGL